MTVRGDLGHERCSIGSALGTQIDGQTAIFLDGPAGTQVPARVIGAVQNYLVNCNANSGGAFATSRRSDEMIANTRAEMADFFHCDPAEVVFGPNMTSLTFAMSRAIGRELGPGDEILLTTLDHDAICWPLKRFRTSPAQPQASSARG